MLGLVGTCNNSGLGVINRFLIKHLPIEAQLLVQHPTKGNIVSWAAKDYVVANIRPTAAQCEEFLDKGVTVLIAVEVPYSWDLLDMCKARGIKVAFMPMLDSVGCSVLRKWVGHIDCLLAPTLSAYYAVQDMGFRRVEYLAVPVDTDFFAFVERDFEDEALFLYNAGYGGVEGRKGSDRVIELWKTMGFRLLMRAQNRFLGDIEGLEIDCGYHELEDMYNVGNVYLALSRKEGVGLPVYEAMSCGLPVIGSNLDVWRGVLHQDLVTSDLSEVRKLITELRRNSGKVRKLSQESRDIMVDLYSWHVWRERYLKVLASL
jgi:glycosyltransferase involved in cell wall biosynthesis